MSTPDPSLLRRTPAVLLHGGVVMLDFAWAAGEAALRVMSLFLGVLFGDKALGAAIEGLIRFVFVGNLWWPVLHAVALLGLVVRTDRRGWGLGLALISGRALFLWVSGAPYFDIGGASLSPGFVRFFWGLLAVLAVAQLVARPPPRYVLDDEGTDDASTGPGSG